MNSTGTEVVSPVGRIVWGHPSKPQQKRDPNTKQIILKDGQPVIQHAFGVAFPKADFSAHIWPAMAAEIAKGFPQGVPQRFSYKYQDGDGIDGNGKPYADREGYAGCYVLTISSSTGIAPNVFKFNPQKSNYDPVPVEGIKTGDYVVVALNLKVNVPTDRTNTPSIYVNPQAIELVGYGPEIVLSGVDPMTAFGGRQHQLPAGASTVPLATAGSVNMPGTSQPQAPAGMPQPGGMPNAGYQPPQMQPQPGAMPGQAPMMQPQAPQYAPPAGVPGQMPPPAQDFTQNAGYQPPQMQPGGMPGQAPMPGQMPGMMPGR